MLPRLAGSDVLLQAICDGLALLTWRSDTFAFAESYDEAAGRYRGLRGGQAVNLTTESAGILVKPLAERQINADASTAAAATTGASGGVGSAGASSTGSETTGPEVMGPGAQSAQPSRKPRRFHKSVELDPARVGRDASRIADEVVAHLVGQVGAEVRVTLEIEASLPDGASDQIVRTATENSRTLKFKNQGFENE
jgi:hypothetical protein